MSILSIARERQVNGAFERGFYGESFDKFDRLGAKTARHLCETNKLLNEIEHSAAEVWLARRNGDST